MAKAHAGSSSDVAAALTLILAAMFTSIILCREIQALGACLLPIAAVLALRGVRGCRGSDRGVAVVTLVISAGAIVMIAASKLGELLHW
jgi:hypothetical protein